MRERQPGMGGRIRRVQCDRSLKCLDRLWHLEHRRGQEVRPAATAQLVHVWTRPRESWRDISLVKNGARCIVRRGPEVRRQCVRGCDCGSSATRVCKFSLPQRCAILGANEPRRQPDTIRHLLERGVHDRIALQRPTDRRGIVGRVSVGVDRPGRPHDDRIEPSEAIDQRVSDRESDERCAFPTTCGRSRRQHRDRPTARDHAPICRSLGHGGHGGNEAVAGSSHRLDVSRRTAGIAEGLAQRGHMDGENALLDEGLWPDAVEEFLLAQEPTGSPDERDEQVERLRRKSNMLAAVRQTTLTDLEDEPAEFVGLVGRHRL
jgi:hypothetical protein